MRSLSSLELNPTRLVTRFGRPRQPFLETDLDLVSAHDSAALRHLAKALPSDVTAGELASGHHPDFIASASPAAPSQPENADSVGAPLRLGTYNLGLLDRPYLHTRVTMPRMRARRAAFARQVLAADLDVWLLQELWEPHDRHRLEVMARDYGYRLFTALGDRQSAHGLAVLVRTEHVDCAEPIWVQGAFYPHQYSLEYRPGPGIRRAWMSVEFSWAPWSRRVICFNTHLTPFPPYWRQRNAQARTLGLAIRRRPPGTIVLGGGDLNADIAYLHDRYDAPDGPPVDELWSCATAHALLRHYGGLDDLADRGGLSRALPTITHENHIHHEMYGRTEPNARLDHLFVNTDAPVTVSETQRHFVQPSVRADGLTVELSDHYGLSSLIRIKETT